jgi:hypothetical protein
MTDKTKEHSPIWTVREIRNKCYRLEKSFNFQELNPFIEEVFYSADKAVLKEDIIKILRKYQKYSCATIDETFAYVTRIDDIIKELLEYTEENK